MRIKKEREIRLRLEDRQKEKIKTSKRCFYLVIAILPLLVIATYTWFTLSTTPSVSEMGMSISSGTGMVLAFEPEAAEEEWVQILDFREVLEDMAPLKPITWSEKEQSFYTASFGKDGRISGIGERLSDEANTNSTSSNSYYMKNTCYAKTGTPVKVTLSPAVVSEDGTKGAGTYVIGTPIWDSNKVSHNNGGNGAEYAVRIGINISKLDLETKERIGENVFYIYEPNCDGHRHGEPETVSTASIDGTEELIPESRLIRQTTSSWNETYPIQRNVVIRELGDFITDTELFELGIEEMAKIDIYVWLEGQDVDCTNEIGVAAQIFANIQFLAEAIEGGGLEEID